MPGKNYHYKTNTKGTHLVLEKTTLMLDTVRSIDKKFLSSVVIGWAETNYPNVGWKGRCPLPLCPSNKRNHGPKDLPAYVVSGKHEGYVFHCQCCKTRLTIYQLLITYGNTDIAEDYAQERWDAGELCGGGWNCPMPQKVRERLLSEKEQRREEYQRAALEQKARNYQNKYGSSATESA